MKTKSTAVDAIVLTVAVGETITVPREYQVEPACTEKHGGIWFCVTHQKKLANQLEKDTHIHHGTHKLAWICFAHGPEKP
jgi:hypothetical protein